MQLLVSNWFGNVEVKCPGCDSLLTTTREQDRRVHIMQHPEAVCRWSKRTLRVDRLSGYAEPWPEVKEDNSWPPTADATRTNISTSAKTPCTTSPSETQPTPGDTQAEALGRITLSREQELKPGQDTANATRRPAKMNIALALLIALIGMLFYFMSANPKLMNIGLIMFASGLLAFLLQSGVALHWIGIGT